jgi:hypothetical protein
MVDAIAEAGRVIAGGADLVFVDVPPGRELTQRAADAGQRIKPWRPGPASRGGLGSLDPAGAPVPTGSQRGLAVLRGAVDEAGAERAAYVRLATVAPPLGAPEQAVVAAFERVDLVATDLAQEIVGGRIAPDRALADHAFAYRLLARAQASLVVGAGPLVVGPDLAAGIPSDPATRAGRALALQLAACAFARASGIAPERIIAGALPDWTVDEPRGPACAAAEVELRRQLLTDHPIAFMEPPGSRPGSPVWWALVAALLPHASRAALVLPRGDHDDRVLPPLAAMTHTAAALGDAHGPASLSGHALDHARMVVDVARSTLEALLEGGWSSIIGEAGQREALGPDTVALRSEPFDPLAPLAAEPGRPLVSA